MARRFPVRNRDRFVRLLTACDTTHLIPALARIVNYTQFTGIGCMDFKLHRKPDTPKLPAILELNPRLCGGMFGTCFGACFRRCVKGLACRPHFCGTIEILGALAGGCRDERQQPALRCLAQPDANAGKVTPEVQ